jgi:Tol biopolymer transport system component
MDWSRDSSKIVYQTGDRMQKFFFTLSRPEKFSLSFRVPAFDCDPAISPDGNQIAFVSDRDGNFEIYIQNLDGSNLRRLTEPSCSRFVSRVLSRWNSDRIQFGSSQRCV